MKARWIWAHRRKHVYNETIVARRSVALGEIKSAKIQISADSFYRLFINDQWINDGPCRSWPEHFQYDVIDVGAYLRKGNNEIKVMARHYGIGDFHGVYQRPGLLMELTVKLVSGKKQTIITDKRWDAAIAQDRLSHTPKISVQMEPAEMVDARLESKLRFHKAIEICGAHDGPWKNIMPRDIRLLSRKPFSIKKYLKASTVVTDGQIFCVPTSKLCNPDMIVPDNYNVGAAFGIATEIIVKKRMVLSLGATGCTTAVNGKTNSNNRFTLNAGRHLILVLSERVASMHRSDKTVSLKANSVYKLQNPLQADHENPWAWIRFTEHHFLKNDLHFIPAAEAEPEIQQVETEYAKYKKHLIKSINNKTSLKLELGSKICLLASNKMFVEDIVWAFQNRQVVDECPKVFNGSAAISDNPDITTIYPSKGGEVELLYDLGEQNLGYWHFDMQAPAGTVIDMFAVEHLFDNGNPQHTLMNRNGFRYIAKEGHNQFTSMKIRSGRYLFVTLRNMTHPVQIRHIGLIESTYPIEYKADFKCSDPQIEKIWDISERTVKLCMTDTYVDCPLYEQTLWVGDARNESLFGYLLFGATDIARRSIRLAAESLERYPMVGCQVPSSWDCIVPAWSFLWGISVWEYYWYTGDTKFLREFWPWIEKNLKGAFGFMSDEGLYSAPHWHLFDWSHIDQVHDTVLHNSMFLVGAIDSAIRCADVLGKKKESYYWRQQSRKLVKSINQYWDSKKKSYPDSIHKDGDISTSVCQHTSFLALLYDVAKSSFAKDCLRNTIHPTKEMTLVASPFAIFYLFECWEKLGLYDNILKSIRDNYIPMLQADATTVWECFPGNNMPADTNAGGPTRSHCHAWSSAPVYFISRIMLGIKQSKPGGSEFYISPWIKNLEWAKGTVMSNFGPISVSWKCCGKKLHIDYKGPRESSLRFVSNESHKNFKLVVNGKIVIA